MDTESSVGIFRALYTCKSSSLKNANELYNSFYSFFLRLSSVVVFPLCYKHHNYIHLCVKPINIGIIYSQPLLARNARDVWCDYH